MTAIFEDINLIIQSKTRMNEIVWSIMGQIYIPKKMNTDTFWWEAIMPTETFIPPHFHSAQDKFLYITEGVLDIVVDGREEHVMAGQIYNFPLQSTHSFFNRYCTWLQLSICNSNSHHGCMPTCPFLHSIETSFLIKIF